MNKQLTGISRVTIYLIIVIYFPNLFRNFQFEYWISDLIHGNHSEASRDSFLVTLLTFLYLGAMSFYILQTILYFFIGSALQNKRTGLFRFVGMLFSAVWECTQNPNFWTSGSGSSSTSNIERVLQFRDSKMLSMTNEQAVDFVRGTGHLEQMMSRPDLPQSRRALNYLDAKLSMMDNESALKFIKGNK